MARMEMDYSLKTFGKRFQVLCLYLAKLIEKLITVCTRRERFSIKFYTGRLRPEVQTLTL